MKKVLLLLALLISVATYADNKIYYKSSTGKVVNPSSKNGFGANIVSNSYSNGQGVITFDGEVIIIGTYAFNYCTELTSVTIPNSVMIIGDGAFESCDNLAYLTIGNSVKIIGDGAFYGCSSLTSLEIPASVTSIGQKAFYNCYGLTSIAVESGNKKYDSRNNCNALIETSSNALLLGCNNTSVPNSVASIASYAFYNCTGLSSVTIPNTVTTIGDEAFYHCFGLTSITIPKSVTSLGKGAFSRCSELTSVEIPNSINSIDDETFYNCLSLTSLTIGNSVTSIGYNAFAGCPNLKTIYAKPTSPPTSGSSIFNGVDKTTCMLYVPSTPSTAYAAYKATSPWSSFATIKTQDMGGDSDYEAAKKKHDVNDDDSVNGADVVSIYNFIVNGK